MDDQTGERKQKPLIWIAVVLAAVAAVVAILARRWRQRRAERLRPVLPATLLTVGGLTESEAEAFTQQSHLDTGARHLRYAGHLW